MVNSEKVKSELNDVEALLRYPIFCIVFPKGESLKFAYLLKPWYNINVKIKEGLFPISFPRMSSRLSELPELHPSERKRGRLPICL